MDKRQCVGGVIAIPLVLVGLWVGFGVAGDDQVVDEVPRAAEGPSVVIPAITDAFSVTLNFIYGCSRFDSAAQRFAKREGEFAGFPRYLSTADAEKAIALWHKVCEAEPTAMNIKARALLADGLQPGDHEEIHRFRRELASESSLAAVVLDVP